MKRRRLKVLYAGDSPLGGPANYMLAILTSLRADFVHVPPSKTLSSSLFRKDYDVIILSDFSEKNASPASQKAILKQVKDGAGFLMIGGWSSFSGPFGGWKGSMVERVLPVSCLAKDDRVNFPSGGFPVLKKRHPSVDGLDFKNPPVICGLNRLRPKDKSITVLNAKRVELRRSGAHSYLFSPANKEYPLFVVNADPKIRSAALATDIAPHWCGGLVDWGEKRIRTYLAKNIMVETGDRYFRFVSSILDWLAGNR